MSIWDLLSNWPAVDDGLKKVVKVLKEVEQKGLDIGVPQKTKNSDVFVERTELSYGSTVEVEEGEIKKSHEPLDGAWGRTKVKAVFKFATPKGKDGTYHVIPLTVRVSANIKLKPQADFGEIGDFAPFYKRMMTDFGGRKEEFCAAMATRMFDDYNKFATIDGVLYHELTHYALAKKFAQKLYRSTVGGVSGRSFESVAEAGDAFAEGVGEDWADWRGLILHDVMFFDERFVWHQECRFYIKSFEQAGKPGYSA